MNQQEAHMRANQLLVSVGVLVATCAGAQAPSVTIPSGFLVTDAVGTEVGLVITVMRGPTTGFSSQVPWVLAAMVVDGTPLVTDIWPGGFSDFGHGPVFITGGFLTNDQDVMFKSTDCSGTPYLNQRSWGSFGDLGIVSGPGWTLYRPVGPPVTQPDQIPMNSIQTGSACAPITTTAVFPRPAVAVVDLRTLFVPPFTIEPFVFDPLYCVRRKLARVR